MKEKGMRGARMPEREMEKDSPILKTSNLKYATEFGNPEDLQKSNEDLVRYVEKNRMKY